MELIHDRPGDEAEPVASSAGWSMAYDGELPWPEELALAVALVTALGDDTATEDRAMALPPTPMIIVPVMSIAATAAAIDLPRIAQAAKRRDARICSPVEMYFFR